jgi:hypothetical protein
MKLCIYLGLGMRFLGMHICYFSKPLSLMFGMTIFYYTFLSGLLL